MAIKILLADDSLTIQKVVELTFSDAETRLMAVGSGDRAVQALDDFAPDIVLADVVMPGLTGYDVCDEVKHRPGGAFVPVVLLTGTFEPFDRARAERVGSDAIVTKPFDSHALQGLVRDLVGRARVLREEAEAATAAAPPPAPELPPTMILSAAELEGVFPGQVLPEEDTGATQAMPALALPESFPLPSAGEGQVEQVQESLYRTMAMRIPTSEELTLAAQQEGLVPPPPPPPPSFHEPEPAFAAEPATTPFDVEPELATEPPPPPPAFFEPELAFTPPPPPPPAFYEPERAFVPPPPPPPPAFYEPERAFVPPPPPPPPAFYEPEPAPPVEAPTPSFLEPDMAPGTEPVRPLEAAASPAFEPFFVEAEPEPAAELVPAAGVPFEIGLEPEAGPVPEEIEVLLEAEPAAEAPELALPAEEPALAAEAAPVEAEIGEPFPEMDEPAPAEGATPWDEGPAVEIPPPPPELAGGPSDSEGGEPITRDIEADLEAFEASGRVRRRPEIWERHAALIGEETPADIDVHGAAREEPAEPAPAADSSELEEIAAAARLEDLSALIPASPGVPAEAARPAAETAVTTAPLGAVQGALSDADVDRIARRVVQLVSDKVVRDIAWEVVPEYAERLVRERIAEVERAG